MRAAFRFLGRGSWLASRDPRVLILAPLLTVVASSQLRDIRHLAALSVLAFGYYRLARIPWRSVRLQWLYLLGVFGLYSLLNGLISGGRVGVFEESQHHVIATLPVLGWQMTAEALSVAATRFVRVVAMALVGFPLAFAMAPGDFGVALRRLGLPDRLALMVDLTVRFIPTVAAEYFETIDAQRVRGYDPTAKHGGPISRLRRMAPVFVPMTVGSLAGAEDTIDALDLRGFGTGRRTWVRTMRFAAADWLVVGAFLAVVAAAIGLNVTGVSNHYLIPFLVGG